MNSAPLARPVRLPLLILALIGIVALLPSPINPSDTSMINSGDTAWMLTATALVLFMTPGVSFFYGGMVRRGSVVSTMLQSFIAMGIVSLLWIVYGFSLAFGTSVGGIIGNPTTFALMNNVGVQPNADFAGTIPFILFSLFQLKFAIITPALITGAFAERVKFNSYMLFIVLFTTFIYCPLAHWTWHPEGFLRQWGVLDFAGGTVVHMSAGIAALVCAIFLGPRSSLDNNQSDLPANIPYVLLGTGLLWFGWFGFNAGSALGASSVAAQAFLTTNTASAAAMLGWIFFAMWRGQKPSALGACIGAVVGLVAITPAAGFVTVGQSMFIGIVSSIISNIAVSLRSRTDVDDTLDVFPCHGVGGIVGMIFTGLFAKDVGLVYGQSSTFLSHLLALVLVAGYVTIGTWVLLKVTNLFVPLRVSPEEEIVGLDMSQHGEQMDSIHDPAIIQEVKIVEITKNVA